MKLSTGKASAFAFINVGLIDLDAGRTLPRQSVIVRGDRISTVGPTDEIVPPDDALVIDGTGRTLMPGLADMHVHITPAGPRAEFDGPEALRRARQFILMFLANGITTVRNMAGTPLHLALRDEVARGTTLGPRILTCGPVLETRFTFPELAEFGRLVTSVDAARQAVREQQAQGFDFIKVYNDIDADIYDAIIETAREIGMQVVGHVAFQKGLDGALKARQDSIEHLRSYDFAADIRPGDIPRARYEGWLYTTPQRLADLAERTAAAGVWNAPTIVVERSLLTDAEMAEARTPDEVDLPEWLRCELASVDLMSAFSAPQRDALAAGRGARAAMVAELDRVGAGLLAGSDCPGCSLVPGRSLLRELELLVESGLSPARALRTATVNAASFLGLPDTGRIAPGARADLLLLESDPLVDIAAVRQQAGVVCNGAWLSAARVRELLLAAN